MCEERSCEFYVCLSVITVIFRPEIRWSNAKIDSILWGIIRIANELQEKWVQLVLAFWLSLLRNRLRDKQNQPISQKCDSNANKASIKQALKVGECANANKANSMNKKKYVKSVTTKKTDSELEGLGYSLVQNLALSQS